MATPFYLVDYYQHSDGSDVQVEAGLRNWKKKEALEFLEENTTCLVL